MCVCVCVCVGVGVRACVGGMCVPCEGVKKIWPLRKKEKAFVGEKGLNILLLSTFTFILP